MTTSGVGIVVLGVGTVTGVVVIEGGKRVDDRVFCDVRGDLSRPVLRSMTGTQTISILAWPG